MAFTDNFKTKILTEEFTNKTLYLGLHNSSGEISESGYHREQISFGIPSTNNGKTTVKNDTKVEFDSAESDWGSIVKLVVYDDSTGGNEIDVVEIDENEQPHVNTNYQFWIDVEGYSIEWGDS